MLKKAKEAAAKGEPESGSTKDLAQAVLDSSHQIWLAGVGAFVRARQGGSKGLETLLPPGEKLEQRAKIAAAETADAASAKAKEMQQMASGTWDKLEQVFEDRVARALSKLGVYTQKHVQKLAHRGQGRAVAVNELLNASGSGTLAGARRTQRPKRTPVSARAKVAPAAGKTKKTAR